VALVEPFGDLPCHETSLELRSYSDVMFPQLARFTDVALPLLRVMVGIVFITSGWSYDTMLVAMNLVIVTTGGRLSLMNWLFHFA
jgi:hypothetical protein